MAKKKAAAPKKAASTDKKMPKASTKLVKKPSKKKNPPVKAIPSILKPGSNMTVTKLKKLQDKDGNVCVILVYPLSFFLQDGTEKEIRQDAARMIPPPGYVIDGPVTITLWRADIRSNLHLCVECRVVEKTVAMGCIVEDNTIPETPPVADNTIPETPPVEDDTPLTPDEVRRSYQTDETTMTGRKVTEDPQLQNVPVNMDDDSAVPEKESALGDVVWATFLSDDGNRNVEFDATTWFADAEEDDLLDLATEDWKNCSTADSIAVAEEDSDGELNEAMRYTESADSGYEVEVNAEQALAWLEKHKPEISAKIKEAKAS